MRKDGKINARQDGDGEANLCVQDDLIVELIEASVIPMHWSVILTCLTTEISEDYWTQIFVFLFCFSYFKSTDKRRFLRNSAKTIFFDL